MLGPYVIVDTPFSLAGAQTVKLMDPSEEYIRQIREEIGPERLIVVRWWHKTQPLKRPREEAQALVVERLPQILSVKDANVVFELGYNEVPDDYIEALSEFDNVLLEAGRRHDFRVGIGQFSAGTPKIGLWGKYQALENLRDQDALMLHEYYADLKDIDNIWHIRRWRVPGCPSAFVNAPKIISETGRDYLEDLIKVGKHPGYPGWRLADIGWDKYLYELKALGDVYAQESTVLGAHVFCMGRRYDTKWDAYQFNAFWHNFRIAFQGENSDTSSPDIAFFLNTAKHWYEATHIFGMYDGHPDYCEDFNLESMGDTDLGEPVTAPFAARVTFAGDLMGMIGKCVEIVSVRGGRLIAFRFKHLRDIQVSAGASVRLGTWLGSIGTAGGHYSAHVHVEATTGNLAPLSLHGGHYMLGERKGELYNFVRPSELLIELGLDPQIVRRACAYDYH